MEVVAPVSVAWSSFDPDIYVADNYLTVANEDRVILEKLSDFYASLDRVDLRIAEVGGGPNLYPLLAALPKAQQILVLEYGARNIDYVRRQLVDLSENWLAFWTMLLARNDSYAPINPAIALAEAVTLVEGSIYEDASNYPATFDVVSTHFCLESITSTEEGFVQGLEAVAAMTKPGGRLIASFLKGSDGYSVGEYEFPAFPLFEPQLTSGLERVGYSQIDLTVVENSGELANEDEWLGMLVVSAVRD